MYYITEIVYVRGKCDSEMLFEGMVRSSRIVY